MGAQSFDALLRSLKRGAPDPVYYFYGTEAVLKDEATRAVLARAVDPAARDFNLDQRSAADLDASAFNALVNTLPLLATSRAVVLKGVEQVRKTSALYKELIRYVERPNPSTVLVLVQGNDEKPDPALVRAATAVQIEPLPPDRVARWMAHRAQEIGLVLEADAGALLLEATGHDLGTLAGELEKLAAAVGPKPATTSTVANLVGVRQGATLADLVGAVLERRPAAAASLVEAVLEQAGMSGVRIVTALGTALVGCALARAELDRGTSPGALPNVLFRHLLAARPFGLGNWKDEAARWARWASRWTAGELLAALHRTLAADIALKSTTVTDERGIVTDLVLTAGISAQQAA